MGAGGARAGAGGAVARAPARARAAEAARVARAAHAHAGPPVAAHVLPLAAPERDPGRGAEDLRHEHVAVPLPAPLGALAADDLPAQRALSHARAGHGGGHAASDGGARGRRPGDARVTGRAAAAAPAPPAPALAAANA